MDHLGFRVQSRHVVGNTLVPRYYNPEIQDRLNELATTRRIVRISDLLDSGAMSVAAGHEIGKMAYGTGSIPFVRTSDLSNYEVKGDPKQGVSEAVFQQYAQRQDIQPGDVLFVRDGTYLVGSTAIVSQDDLPMLLQSHVLRFRVNDGPDIDRHLFLAAMNMPIVRRQLRSKQFTADIIDTVGNRYREIYLPLPPSEDERRRVSAEVRAATERRSELRRVLRYLPLWLEGTFELGEFSAIDDAAIEDVSTSGFTVRSRIVGDGPLIPRYYSPVVDDRMQALRRTHDLVSIGSLVDANQIRWSTGIEVGKMAYGGGGPAFLRTSDLSTWELKVDPKQTVSPEVYAQYGPAQDVRPDDIFVVRDGTYLVGSSAIVTQADGPLLFAGGLYKLRATGIDPFLLLVLLNAPIVRKQMRTKQFTRDVIDTLGKRLFEVYLPIPRDPGFRTEIANLAREAVTDRSRLRASIRDLALGLEGDAQAAVEAEELEAEPA